MSGHRPHFLITAPRLSDAQGALPFMTSQFTRQSTPQTSIDCCYFWLHLHTATAHKTIHIALEMSSMGPFHRTKVNVWQGYAGRQAMVTASCEVQSAPRTQWLHLAPMLTRCAL
ncbi:hypothetical protein E2C01_017051 [Portunus trituberculatus]|uniref:Uncharacterized protein n=1 Tax=Portunus trituberculatus TaxID=210409 RepID=A0A5B7DQV3_PORTR|nr:hypothetical protein [Portunus trituberculatus]